MATATPDIGLTMTSGQDEMVMNFVPAGEFMMGSSDADVDAEQDEKPQHAVYLAAYWMDRTEVTNALYARCVTAEVCTPVISLRSDAGQLPDYPVQGVTWTQSSDYCQWVGRRLPTEAEWEKAARGVDGRIYPWGNTPPDPIRANFDSLTGDAVAAHSYLEGASPYGILQMAGNVWEWSADWYTEDYYEKASYENPQGAPSGIMRVLRGGAWNTTARALRVANRFWAFPQRNDFDGFRCALTSTEQ
jgi:serine/threonine-protein kinase